MHNTQYRDTVKRMPIVRQMVDIVRKADPTARLILYGSRARGDHREDSDWDLLVLLQKDDVQSADRERFWDSMEDLSLASEQEINTTVYPQSYWNRTSFSPFHHNVDNDGIVLL